MKNENESVKNLMKLKSDMVRDRDFASRKGKWEKVIRFALPELGDESIQDNFASEGQLYTRQVSEALQGWAYGSNIDWVRIAIKGLEEDQENNRDIRSWCQSVENLIKEAFDNSHFYQEALLFTSICFNLSTSIMYVDYDRDAEEFIFKVLDPRQCLIKFNRNQKLRLFMYDEKLDHIDAVEQFGNDLPKEIRECTNLKKKWRFTHVIAHVPTFDITGIDGDGEWAEFYICEDLQNSEPLKPRRINRCPVVVWRFKRNIQSISSWGCGSPGEIGITDLVSINLMQKSDDILIQRIAEPPIVATSGLRNINIRPSGITYLNHGEDYTFKSFNANGQQLILNAITLKQERLKEIYYVNFFLIFQQALTSGQRTATEAGLIDDEKTQNMSSFSSNLVVEFLEPVINAVYDILLDQGKLPSPPASIAEKEIKVDFISQLAISQQRSSILTPINRILSLVFQFAQADPTLLRKLNWGAIIDKAAEIENVDTDVLTPTEDYNRQQEAQAQANAQQQNIDNELAMLEAQSKAYKNMSAAPEAGSPMASSNNQQ